MKDLIKVIDLATSLGYDVKNLSMEDGARLKQAVLRAISDNFPTQIGE